MTEIKIGFEALKKMTIQDIIDLNDAVLDHEIEEAQVEYSKRFPNGV